mgnify:CR=1 FL=1
MARQSLLSVVLGLRTDQFEKGLSQAQRQLRNTANNISAVGRSMTLGITAPLTAVGASSFKVAADFELAMKKVKAVSGATGQEFASLSKNAEDLGASTVFSASSVADLQLEFAKLGLSAGEITKATGSTLALAQAFDQELGPTAATVGSTLAQFGLEADQAGRVADVMAAAFGGSALDLDKFSEGMKNAGPVAAEFGFSLEETTALLGVLANNGIAGSDAGTKLKMAFSELASAGVDVKSTFTGIINGSMSYADAIGILGKRAAILQPIFGKNLEDIDDLGKALNNAEGRAADMAKEMDATAKGGLAAMKSAVEAAQISIGRALAPTVTAMIGKIKDFAQSFSRLDPQTQKTIVNMGLFAAAIGPVTSAIGGMVRGVQDSVRAFKAASKFLLTNPYGIVIAGAVALGGALYSMSQDSYIANDAVLDFNETIEAQNDLLSEGVRSLAARAALLREAFSLEAEGETIGALQQQTRALRTELENISPEAFDQFNQAAIDLANNPLLSAQIGLVPVIDPNTGQIDEAARQINLGLISEFAGVEFSTFTLDIISSLDPFGDGVDTQTAFKEVERILTQELANTQKVLDEKSADLESKVNVVVDVQGGGGGRPEETLQSVQAELRKTLADISELENLFGENLSADKFSAIERAITKIVEADFANADEVLASLTAEMGQYASETERAQTPLETLNERINELRVAQGLGLTSDVELAQQALSALDQALTQSLLNDPEFANTEKFQELIEQAQAFQNVLAGATEQQQEANEALFDAQAIGQATGDFVALGFKAATGEVDNFGQAAGQMFLSMIANAAKAAIANAVAAAFAPTPDNLATGGAAGAAKAASYKALIASLFASIPKLKHGGMTLGPQLALIGDNASGREAVIPFERMGQFLSMVNPAFGATMKIAGMLRGSDIVLSQQRANRNRGR